VTETFNKLPHRIFDSVEYRALQPIDRDILALLIRRHNGFNNGKIPLGNREAAIWWQVDQSTACRSLQRLERAGLVQCTDKGRRGPYGARASRWLITFLQPNVEE
jgi:hypothetical protein